MLEAIESEAVTDRERLDRIGGVGAAWISERQLEWIVGLARRLLAVEEAARTRHHGFRARARCPMCEALADLDEWRKEQP